MSYSFRTLAEDLWRLWRDEDGQNMVEHALLLGFVTLVTVGLMIGPGEDVKGVWSTANSELITANRSAS
jgi:Flp pilus assembly pilin Flp